MSDERKCPHCSEDPLAVQMLADCAALIAELQMRLLDAEAVIQIKDASLRNA